MANSSEMASSFSTASTLPSSSSPNVNSFNTVEAHQNFVRYLHTLSGQVKVQMRFQIDHSYAKPWNQHPDPDIRARPARFLFMNSFPRHLKQGKAKANSDDVTVVDVVSSDEENEKYENPLSSEIQSLASLPSTANADRSSSRPGLESDDLWGTTDKPPVNKIGWTSRKVKLYTKSIKILNTDRLARLNAEGKPNEYVIKRNILERTASRFRQLFSSIALWDPQLLTWLHSTLHAHVISAYLICYHESMQLLRQKMSSLIDKFYTPIKLPDGSTYSRQKVLTTDPIQTVVNNHRPKRIAGSPLFLIVPSAPQMPHHLTSQRMKHWNNLFGSLGKVINVSVPMRPRSLASDCLNDIRVAVKEKIKECKSTFSETRPLVLVGFGSSSLIAAHCALENAQFITATVCLGFPLTGVNGFRGDLDDPLLETNVPTMFVIGQNSSMCTLDDMEDFRERITKTITGLVVVGGCNDRLILCNAKKKTETITQPMVDRCIADEIYDFVSSIINPNHTNESTKSHRSSHNTSNSNIRDVNHSHNQSTASSGPSTPTTPVNASVNGKGHNFSTPTPTSTPVYPVSLASLNIDSLKNRPLTVPGVIKRKKNPVRPEKIQAMSAPPTPPSSASSYYTVNSATLSERLQQTGAHQWSTNSLKKVKLEPQEPKTEEQSQVASLEAKSEKTEDVSEPAVSTSSTTAGTNDTSATSSATASSESERQEKHTKETQLSYSSAPVQAISASSTRTGRTIKVPSKLDM